MVKLKMEIVLLSIQKKFFVIIKILIEGNEINIFFDNKNYNLIGWQTLDIYQNLSITYISKIKKNEKLKTKLFDLPQQN